MQWSHRDRYLGLHSIYSSGKLVMASGFTVSGINRVLQATEHDSVQSLSQLSARTLVASKSATATQRFNLNLLGNSLWVD